MTRLAFLGSPGVSARCLRELYDAGHDIALVVTAADKRRGRGGALLPTPVKQVATVLGLPTTDQVADVVAVGVDLGVVVAFGQLIKKDVLDQLLLVNVHFSLLPRWRGAAPVERALLAGDLYTGVSLMKLESTLDTGGIYATVTTPIGPDETAVELRDRLGRLGAKLLVEHLQKGVGGLGEPVAQSGEPSYATKLSSGDLRLDFARPATHLARVVRLGRAWTTWRDRRLLVHRASAGPPLSEGDAYEPGTIVDGRVATAEGWFVPLEVQGEGRRRQGFAEWVRGVRPLAGERLGNWAGGDTDRADSGVIADDTVS
ncbi:MAG: methionyl-tRNA formyltransferase [Acidimicrobiales bacterium]